MGVLSLDEIADRILARFAADVLSKSPPDADFDQRLEVTVSQAGNDTVHRIHGDSDVEARSPLDNLEITQDTYDFIEKTFSGDVNAAAEIASRYGNGNALLWMLVRYIASLGLVMFEDEPDQARRSLGVLTTLQFIRDDIEIAHITQLMESPDAETDS